MVDIALHLTVGEFQSLQNIDCSSATTSQVSFFFFLLLLFLNSFIYTFIHTGEYRISNLMLFFLLLFFYCSIPLQ